MLGIIVGLAIAATLHNYSNYKKEKAIETDESSSITSSDHNETTTATTTTKTTTTTTTATTTTSQTTTTTTSSKVPITWVKTDVDKIVGEYKVEATEWRWEEDLPSRISINDVPRFHSPTAAGTINIDGCDFIVNLSFNSDAQERDLVVMVYDDAFRKDGEELDEYKITYSENNSQATITGSVNILDKTIVIKSKSTGKELKAIPVELHSGNQIELISSDPNIIEFFEQGFVIHNTGKVKISCKINSKIVAQKDIEVDN